MNKLNGHTVHNILPAPVTEAGKIDCARTYDGSILREFYLDRKIWDIMQCDDSPDAADVDFDQLALDNSNVFLFVTASYNDELAGLFMFHVHSPHCYEIHSALLPKFWGRSLAHLFGLEACKWIVENTDCEKITTSVPSFNDPALHMAMEAGMTLEGNNRLSFMKDGQLYDQALLGFTKGELLCP